MKPGVYYDIPAAEYHLIDAVSASRLQDMMISPLECWSKHIDPTRDMDDEPTPAQQRGTAYHVRLLEGENAFLGRYARIPDIEDYPDAYAGADDLRKMLGDYGLKKSGTIAEMSARLLETGVNRDRLWHFIVQDFNEDAGTRTPIKSADYDRIQKAGNVLDAAGIGEIFEGGKPEVTIIWENGKGVKCKARLDMLKKSAAIDLKTFANKMGKPVSKAASDAFIFGRHHLQAYWYQYAWQHATQKGWLPVPEKNAHRFWNIYYQTTGAPNVVVREFKKVGHAGANNYWLSAKNDIEYAFNQYCWFTFERGTRPWIGETFIKGWSDTDFPSYTIDS